VFSLLPCQGEREEDEPRVGRRKRGLLTLCFVYSLHMLTIEMRGITEGHIPRLTATAEGLTITNGIAFAVSTFYFNTSLHEEGTFSVFPEVFYNSDFCL
jgi:hypothetical protein